MSARILVEGLPSGKDFYGEGKQVYIKKYGYGHMVDVTTSEDEYTTIMAASAGIVADFDIYDIRNGLTYNDYQYCMLFRKLSVPEFGAFTVKFDCKCGAENSFAMKVDEISFKPKPEGSEKMPIVLQYGESESEVLEFMPYTLGMHLDLLKRGKRTVLDVQAVMITNLGFDEAKNLLYEIDNEFFADAMLEVANLLDWGVAPVERKCKKCGKKNTVNLDGNGVLLLSKGKHQESFRCRVLRDPVQAVHGGRDTGSGL